MRDIFSGIRGIGNDNTPEVPAEDKTGFWFTVLTGWVIIAFVALMIWGGDEG